MGRGNCVYVDKLHKCWLSESDFKKNITKLKRLRELPFWMEKIAENNSEVILFKDGVEGWTQMSTKEMNVVEESN